MNNSPLLTDFYQITMAYGYWKKGMAEQKASFYMTFRSAPFHGEYLIFAGLGPLLEKLESFRFNAAELDYLANLKDSQGNAVFEKAFIDYLANLTKLEIVLEAPPEGSLVFAHEPIIRVTGPLLQAQLLETLILNAINFQSLIATKASRICLAANDKPILEFGLRRAQGPNGAVSVARAAFIGGCQSTSNTLAGYQLGIPVSGTQAHSWIMSFDDEVKAFNAFADIYGKESILLVDTYHTLAGVKHAIDIAKQKLNNQLKGIRLDSGDLTYLSQTARKMLDNSGLKNTKIFASSDLDEYIISDLEHQKACIDAYGVGTKLATAYDQPALGGVYKISALQDLQGHWQYKLKVSEQVTKTSTPGLLKIKRFYENNIARYDMVYDELLGIPDNAWIIDPNDPTRRREVDNTEHSQELLQPVFSHGKMTQPQPTLFEIQLYAKQQLQQFHPSIYRLLNPHNYPVGLEKQLYDLKMAKILALKNNP